MSRREEHESAETLEAPLASRDGARGPADSGEGVLVAGRYRVLELLGSGGMGTVYRAHDVELEEDVALKTLRRERIEAPGALERFRREVKLARKVTHRSIARVFDLGEHGGDRFLTMELVVGRSLARAIAEVRALEPPEAIRVAVAICEGLAAAHAAGVVHRDLKPDNVLLEAATGRVVVTDFGVARAMAAPSDARATGAGGIVGTPAYMAPEQVDGGEVDARTDLYALGVALFEMLTGELPFEGESALAMAAARLVRPPRALSAVRPDLPPALGEIVARALSRAPAGRFASAAEMREALGRVATERAAASPRPRSVPPVPVEERRIAVLPLRSLGAAEDAWVAEGLGEDLSDALSMIRGVRVRTRTGAPAAGEDVRLFARRHGVEALVEGTVRREGDRFRASLRLVSAEDGFQIWARRYDGSIGEALRISDEAAQAIAHALAGAIAPSIVRPVPVAEAVELLLRAKLEAASFVGIENARGLLERARALAPDDPSILSEYATHMASAVFGPGAGPELLVSARAAAERARALAPHLPEPHVALARTYFAACEDVEAVRLALEAKRLAPGHAEADDLLGRILAELDLGPEAVGHLERALWADPTRHFARVDLVRIHMLAGRAEQAEVELDEIGRRSPPHRGLVAMRMALWQGRPELAGPAPDAPYGVIASYHRMIKGVLAGEAVSAEDWAAIDAIIASAPERTRSRRLFWQMQAELASAAGDMVRARAGLRGAVEAGLLDLAWVRRCPVIAPLRAEHDYATLARAVEARVAPVVTAYREGTAALAKA